MRLFHPKKFFVSKTYYEIYLFIYYVYLAPTAWSRSSASGVHTRWNHNHTTQCPHSAQEAKAQEQAAETLAKAKAELAEFYAKYEANNKETAKRLHEEEQAFLAAQEDKTTGRDWDRVGRLVDFSSKGSKNTRDVAKLKSTLLQACNDGIDVWRCSRGTAQAGRPELGIGVMWTHCA